MNQDTAFEAAPTPGSPRPMESTRPRRPPMTPKVRAGLALLVEEANACIEFLEGSIANPVSTSKSLLAEFKARCEGIERARDWIERRLAAGR